MNPTNYSFVDRLEYLHDIAEFARGASKGDRIVVMAMTFDPSTPPVAEMVQQLAAAAQRGAEVLVLVDAFIFLMSKSSLGPLWYGRELSARSVAPFGKRFAALESVREAGGQYVITNMPHKHFSMPYGGRSHMKFALLGNQVYIGGHNLEKPDDIDVMATWEDPETAAYLYALAQHITKTGSPRVALDEHDTQHRLNDSSALLLDAGIPKQSLILEQALQLINDARERLCMTCQYFPGGQTGQALAAAVRRGVAVTLYYSPASKHGVEMPGHYAYEQWARQHLPRELFAHRMPKERPMLHAKVLVSERAALLGSHNYVGQGVRFGTAEIALHSTDTAFGAALQQSITKLIKNEN